MVTVPMQATFMFQIASTQPIIYHNYEPLGEMPNNMSRNNLGKPHHMASDGSVQYQKRMHGYVWANEEDTIIHTGRGKVEGNVTTMSSYRAEAQGMASCIQDLDNAELSHMTLWMDNAGVVQRVNRQYPVHPLQPEWDLIEPLRLKTKQMGMQVWHVKGHQDKTNKSPIEIKLNHEADKLATEAQQKPTGVGTHLPGYRINLYIGDQKITTRYAKEIRHVETTLEIREYYINKHRWNDRIMGTIAWDAHSKVLQTFSTTKKKTIHQYLHGWLPTGEVIKRRHRTT